MWPAMLVSAKAPIDPERRQEAAGVRLRGDVTWYRVRGMYGGERGGLCALHNKIYGWQCFRRWLW